MFSTHDWVFTLKTFGAAMIALWIAYQLGLENPYWSMAAVYVVAQPLDAATRSKSLYRFSGTVLGAAAAIVLVPALVNKPILLSIALALWTGTCLFVSLLDRTPRAYASMLAGYTAGIVGYGTFDNPGSVFTIGLARTEEITLGVICATLMSSLVFPRSLGPVLSARTDKLLDDVTSWARGTLTGRSATGHLARHQRRVAADAVGLQVLSESLAWDHSRLARSSGPFTALRQRVLLLFPLISSIADRVDSLQTAGGVPIVPARLMREVSIWLEHPAEGTHETDALRAAIVAAHPNMQEDGPPWEKLLVSSLLTRLRELLDIVEDVHRLRKTIRTGQTRLPPGLHATFYAKNFKAAYHTDPGMAFISALCCALSILVLSAFWVESAWPDGATAATLTAVGCAIFAQRDDPAPAVWDFLKWNILVIVLDYILLFAVLPRVTDFPMLVLSLGVLFIPAGLLVTRPATAIAGLALTAVGGSDLALQNGAISDFGSYANTSVATVVGYGTAAIGITILRSVSAAWTVRRLSRATWADVAELGSLRNWRGQRPTFLSRTLDRLGLLTPRLAETQLDRDEATDTLVGLRVGLGLAVLQDELGRLPSLLQARAKHVIKGVSEHFGAQVASGHALVPPSSLLVELDDSIGHLLKQRLDEEERLVQVMVGLRCCLFPNAEGYCGTTAPELVG